MERPYIVCFDDGKSGTARNTLGLDRGRDSHAARGPGAEANRGLSGESRRQVWGAPNGMSIADPVAVFIDLQAYFCTAEYGYLDADGEAAVADAIDSVNAFLDRYRDTGRQPIFVRTHHDEASNSPVWTRKYERRDEPVPCRPGSDGAAFAAALDVRPSDIVLTKYRYDAFYGTPLDAYLSANGVTRLLVGGVATHVCVESAMRSAFDRDYDATVLADCTASADVEAKREALDRIDGSFGSVAASETVDLDQLDRT